MKWQVIAEDRSIWLTLGPLRSTTSHYTIDFSRLCFSVIRRNLSYIFEYVQNVKTACDTLRLLDHNRQNCRGSHTTWCRANVGVGGGASQTQNRVVWGLPYIEKEPMYCYQIISQLCSHCTMSIMICRIDRTSDLFYPWSSTIMSHLLQCLTIRNVWVLPWLDELIPGSSE